MTWLKLKLWRVNRVHWTQTHTRTQKKREREHTNVVIHLRVCFHLCFIQIPCRKVNPLGSFWMPKNEFEKQQNTNSPFLFQLVLISVQEKHESNTCKRKLRFAFRSEKVETGWRFYIVEPHAHTSTHKHTHAHTHTHTHTHRTTTCLTCVCVQFKLQVFQLCLCKIGNKSWVTYEKRVH